MKNLFIFPIIAFAIFIATPSFSQNLENNTPFTKGVGESVIKKVEKDVEANKSKAGYIVYKAIRDTRADTLGVYKIVAAAIKATPSQAANIVKYARVAAPKSMQEISSLVNKLVKFSDGPTSDTIRVELKPFLYPVGDIVSKNFVAFDYSGLSFLLKKNPSLIELISYIESGGFQSMEIDYLTSILPALNTKSFDVIKSTTQTNVE